MVVAFLFGWVFMLILSRIIKNEHTSYSFNFPIFIIAVCIIMLLSYLTKIGDPRNVVFIMAGIETAKITIHKIFKKKWMIVDKT